MTAPGPSDEPRDREWVTVGPVDGLFPIVEALPIRELLRRHARQVRTGGAGQTAAPITSTDDQSEEDQ